jgi:hypothetical protein
MRPASLPNRQAAAASGILGALILIVLIAGNVFVGATSARRFELDVRQTELAVLQRRLAARPREESDPAGAIAPFLAGATLSLAANSLQERVTSLIDELDATLLSIGVEPAGSGEAANRVRVQAHAEMDIVALQELLYRLESETPFVFVDSLLVERIAPRSASDDDDDDDEEPQMLRVDLHLSGYWRGSAR